MKEARDLGIDVAGKNIAQLQAAITQATEGGEGHVVGGENPGVKPKKGHTIAHVKDKEGNLVRSYNVDDHGDEFADLANEFASKVGGRTVETE